MQCWRIDLQRKLPFYLHKELSLAQSIKLETHLLDCNFCRAKLAKLQSAQALSQQLFKVTPKNDPWQAIEDAIIKQSTERLVTQPKNYFFLKPNFRTAIWFIAGVILTSFLFTSLIFVTKTPANNEKEERFTDADFSADNFRVVSINEMPNNTEPHIVTEGYVSEIRAEEDGDAIFKLVERLGENQNQPFIVCEIIDPIKVNMPKIGSKVKVYGVSRYDGKSNHNWYEVHPVLNIELVEH
jgi:hypothetical protein